MTVGEALAEARYRAGLSVDEVSERTRIREAVIRCIEQDDYDACGGDLYVRGYVRAIAGAVGIDAQPLIREYDLGRADAPGTIPYTSAVPDSPSTADTLGTAVGVRGADSVLPITRPEPILPPSTAPGPVLSGAAADAAIDPATAPGGTARTRSRRRAMAVLVVLALAVAGGASGLVVSSLRHAQGKNVTASAAAATKDAQHGGAAQQGSGAVAAPKAAESVPAAAAEPTPAKPAPAKTSSRTRVRPLPIALAAAFGPDGTADGDNPQGALFAITPGAPLPWRSQWYATAHFGLLKSGTGLLLDMGRRVTITSVRIVLAPYRGADLQLRVGDAAVPASLTAAARAVDVGGTVRLHLRSPVRARYLLIWFTLLPPNGTGQYQASVYRVVVNGRR